MCDREQDLLFVFDVFNLLQSDDFGYWKHFQRKVLESRSVVNEYNPTKRTSTKCILYFKVVQLVLLLQTVSLVAVRYRRGAVLRVL